MKRILALAVAAIAAPAFASDAAPDFAGAWRITHGVVAPWAVEAPMNGSMIGKPVAFAASVVTAPAPLGCENAKYELTRMPPEGLFQGGLPEPAQTAASNLGFAEGEIAGFSLSCDTGVFEFHKADEDAHLFALDNVVWTISRAYGASAPAGSPESVVETLLEFHFNRDRGFTEASARARRKWLSMSLAGAIDAYFDHKFPADDVPPIDGDPFTDSQEYPTRFAVRAGVVRKAGAEVPVDFADGFSKKRIVYRLTYSAGGWRIDDLSYAHGATLKSALRAVD